ncbi:anti-sigma-F factor Fin family protein [Cytobacillus purgationiresistens]|uniref:DUF2757 domain-containing protein n=1 Tax=Cytobacillus purgationiresistens TaxID=863449 RepID=A0ABU0AQP4_9BACI|nr:anti-sigma-F factor Fin family protein [Cytobacillus purgationiresistens]MDQ0273097.1 hypothetical protein [Cytobacillus purgationiresistens]
MAIHYYCRHCDTKLGSIEEKSVHAEHLGFHKLNDEERQDMISYNSSGDMQVKAICEDCQESLERNPDYHQQDFLIH